MYEQNQEPAGLDGSFLTLGVCDHDIGRVLALLFLLLIPVGMAIALE